MITNRFTTRTISIGIVAAVVLVVGLALALGGSPRSKQPDVRSIATSTAGAPALPSTQALHGQASTSTSGTGSAGNTGSAGQSPQFAASGTSAEPADNTTNGSSAAATKIVKTGSIQLSVAKGKVGSTMTQLAALASSEGGYVATSRTNSGVDPSGSITIRVPVGKFEDALATAAKYGKVTNSSTHAQDVTGKYVDLNAQEHALEQTRATYLTILSHASTIGATLAVQQRIDDVQQQIDELHGQIKVLSNQSSYSTLTAYVAQQGQVQAVAHHHSRSGLSKAWHTSWTRFNRGIDAIVGAIGPIVLVLILLALLGLIVRFGVRAAQHEDGKETAPSPSH